MYLILDHAVPSPPYPYPTPLIYCKYACLILDIHLLEMESLCCKASSCFTVII